MRKKIEWEWEEIERFGDMQRGGASVSGRIKVIGGWIVIHSFQLKGHVSESSVFIADRDHEWHILKPEKEESPPQGESVSEGF